MKSKDKEAKKKSGKKTNGSDDFLAQEAAEEQAAQNEYTLDIPEDEIWTYQIEGLQAPHIGKPYTNALGKKIVFIVVLLIAIFAAIFLSVRAVHSDLYTYEELGDGTYKLVRFSNTGDITEVTVDYVVDLETGEKDLSKPISEIDEYAFNCDEKLNTITIGKDVKKIDGKSIYSCWYVQNVFVDDENEYYCDIDGVVYTKDVTTAVFYPNDHDKQLRIEYGYADENGGSLLIGDDGEVTEELWGTTKRYDEAYYQKYNRETRTYVIPSTVTTIGELAFAYSNIVDLYIPEGVTKMDNMAIFKNTSLVNIYSYTTDETITDTTYKAIDSMREIYWSLPEGLEYIGSDCMYYLRGLSYMYIPSSVAHIGHHAFWDAVYKDGDELVGISSIDVAADETSFNEKCETGDQWRPRYDYKLFKKSVDLNYSAERKAYLGYNVHRQYYWAVQWMINNLSDADKALSAYLVKDLDSDGVPELVLRTCNAEDGTLSDRILTFRYGYLYDYSGEENFTDDEFSKLDDQTQIEKILEDVE